MCLSVIKQNWGPMWLADEAEITLLGAGRHGTISRNLSSSAVGMDVTLWRPSQGGGRNGRRRLQGSGNTFGEQLGLQCMPLHDPVAVGSNLLIDWAYITQVTPRFHDGRVSLKRFQASRQNIDSDQRFLSCYGLDFQSRHKPSSDFSFQQGSEDKASGMLAFLPPPPPPPILF